MSKESFGGNIDIGLPIVDEYLCLKYNEIVKVVKSEDVKRQLEEQFKAFLKYLSELSGNINPIYCYNNITMDYDETNNKFILKFSIMGLYKAIFNMLDCNPEPGTTWEAKFWQNGLKKLSKIKNAKELERQFPIIYEKIYKNVQNIGYKDLIKLVNICNLYECFQDDVIQLNILKDQYKRIGRDLEEDYRYAKNCVDFSTFIKNTVSAFQILIDKHDEIQNWTTMNPINLRVGSQNNKKIHLYIIYSLIEYMLIYILRGFDALAQKQVLIIEKYINKYQDLFFNDKTEIYCESDLINGLDEGQKMFTGNFNIQKLIDLFNEQVKKHPSLKTNVILPDFDENLTLQEKKDKINQFLLSLLDETIADDKNNGAVDITDQQIDDKIQELEDEIKSKQISEENRNLKKLILKKIRMVLIDIKPKAKQTGTGIFKNYYVYFYENGMVAVDKLDGYGALYIMPVHVYKEARYKKSLIDVRRISGVKYITHKSKEWLSNAKTCILEGSHELNDKDIKEAETVASINFPYTLDKMEELQKQLEDTGNFTKAVANETKRRINQIKRMEEIDQELSEQTDNELSLDEYESEEEEYINEDKPFDDSYEDWKKKHLGIKVKRNPVIAAITKNRARDEEGNYCCEMCDAKNFEPSSFDSHHMIPLASGGIDNIYNTICLCPNCHRYVHSKKVTLYQRYKLFMKIRKHLEEENPEYISKLDDMISSIAKSEEDYENNKEVINDNFAMLWNSENYKLR